MTDSGQLTISKILLLTMVTILLFGGVGIFVYGAFQYNFRDDKEAFKFVIAGVAIGWVGGLLMVISSKIMKRSSKN